MRDHLLVFWKEGRRKRRGEGRGGLCSCVEEEEESVIVYD
jgi:hypothetical protein